MNKKTTLLNAALAGLIATGGIALVSSQAQAADDHCYGVNSCKGKGECGGKGSSCAGNNTCKGQGWIKMDKEACLKAGGSLEPVAAAKGMEKKEEAMDKKEEKKEKKEEKKEEKKAPKKG
jgi:uncharacterized membrane protein